MPYITSQVSNPGGANLKFKEGWEHCFGEAIGNRLPVIQLKTDLVFNYDGKLF